MEVIEAEARYGWHVGQRRWHLGRDGEWHAKQAKWHRKQAARYWTRIASTVMSRVIQSRSAKIMENVMRNNSLIDRMMRAPITSETKI